MQRTALFILVLVLLSCEWQIKQVNTEQLDLELGKYRLNRRFSSDTLRFQLFDGTRRGWNDEVWEIKRDSIIRPYIRGAYYSGRGKCSYSLNGDTLTLRCEPNFKSLDKSNKRASFEKYIVLKSSKDSLELIDLNTNEADNKIRSDIQLR